MARISEDVSKVRMYVGPAIMYGVNLITLFAMVIPYMILYQSHSYPLFIIAASSAIPEHLFCEQYYQ